METRPWHRLYEHNVPATLRYPGYPVQQMLHISAAMFPHKAATNLYGSELSFAQLRNQVLRMANALTKLGIKKGDRIGMAMLNCPQFIIGYYAILSVGGIVVNMNPLYTHDELKFMMENTGMTAIFTYDGALSLMRPLAKESGLKFVIVTKISDYMDGAAQSSAKSLDLEEGWHHFSELLDGSADTRIPRVKISSSDPALIQFTGGTTGLPKGAVLTHGNIVSAAFVSSTWGESINQYVPHARRQVISVIPFFHVYGNICCINWSMFNAGTQILLPRFDIDEVLGIIAHTPEITYFPSVPTMVTAIVNHPKAEKIKIGDHLRLLSSGGAPMPMELILKVQDMGIFFSEGWGMSETTSSGISNPIMNPRIGAIGIPQIDFDVKLVDTESGKNEVSQGEPGEILIKGPTIMREYWNNPEETAGQLKEGWLYTGDIAQADEDGYLYIVDRKKDMIIAGGFNIYPREVDEVLFQHPKIAEAVAAGIPDAYRGETLKAFIVLKPGEQLTEKEVIEFCKQKLAPYKVPKMVEFRQSIPKSSIGKIMRKILREEEIAKIK
ncbi:MAG: AMP-binding protein [Syntrophales bacterium]|jgi:long-chain acyl-CoA synthetase|nr:AMP-binding protein [Syntrophales bacterium]MDY0043595.1 AMP-binding protein [Syntrophales bacterium]